MHMVTCVQGLDDIVVPVEQATAIYEALETRGVPTALVLFEVRRIEQHRPVRHNPV